MAPRWTTNAAAIVWISLLFLSNGTYSARVTGSTTLATVTAGAVSASHKPVQGVPTTGISREMSGDSDHSHKNNRPPPKGSNRSTNRSGNDESSKEAKDSMKEAKESMKENNDLKKDSKDVKKDDKGSKKEDDEIKKVSMDSKKGNDDVKKVDMDSKENDDLKKMGMDPKKEKDDIMKESIDSKEDGMKSIQATRPMFPVGMKGPTDKLSNYMPIVDPDTTHGCNCQASSDEDIVSTQAMSSKPANKGIDTMSDDSSGIPFRTVSFGDPNTPNGSFIVPIVKRLMSSDKDVGMTAMLKTINKYPQWNISMPEGPRYPHSKRGIEGFVEALPANNFAEYVSPVIVGGQKISLAFDSGSSDLWVFSSNLPAASKGKHATYNPQLSRDSRPLPGRTWQISYGDGSGASGNVVLDTVSIAGISVTNQAIEVANKVSPQFVMDPGTDGLLGLAFSKINTVKPQRQTTYFDNVSPSLTFPVYSVDLTGDSRGSFQFGNVDPSRYRGSLTYTPINAAGGFWEVPSKKFAIGNKVFSNLAASPAIADTGTSLMLVDQAVADKYYSQIPGAVWNRDAGGYVYACTTPLLNFSVQMGPTYFATIPKELITYTKTTSGKCFGGIQGNGQGKMQIYGDLFFRAQYVVFDAGTRGGPALYMAPKF